MRREDRQMSAEWALDVMKRAPYITVSMTDEDGFPYSVPLSLANTDDTTFYFHGAKEGRKIDILKKNPRVCLSAVTKCHPLVGPKDDSFTLEFQSAIANGIAELVEDEAEKKKAMYAICERFLPNHMAAFETAFERSIAHTAIVRIKLTEPPSGKRKQYDNHGEEMKWQRME